MNPLTSRRRVLVFCLLAACVASLVGCGARNGGERTEPKAPGVIAADKRLLTQSNLRAIGEAYLRESQTGWVSGPKALGSDVGPALKSARDEKPFEIVWNFKRVDPTIPAGSKVLLAWEKTADAQGGRFVLLANFATVEYLFEKEFKRAIKAKSNR
jgi:hypothetical protein